MPMQRKLGRATDQRLAILKNLVTAFIQNGKITTTEARAKEVKNIAEGLIALAVREQDNFKVAVKKFSRAKVDSKGKKITSSVTSKNGKKYLKIDREIYTEDVRVDNPPRLHARRQMFKWLYKIKDSKGDTINLTDRLFDDLAPKYKKNAGGYSRIYKLGPRRGDAAEEVILELI